MPSVAEGHLTELLRLVPLSADLDDDERKELSLGMRLLRFEPGETLIRQGAKPDGAYFILRGWVRVTTALPGGGEALIADRGAGSMIGELALIQSTVRTASVTATEKVEAIYADWRFLSAALVQLRPGAFKLYRRLAQLLAGRLRLLHDSIRETILLGDHPYEMLQLPPEPDGATERSAPSGLDVDAFLPVLPCFRDFDDESIRSVRARGWICRPRRGHRLAALGQATECVYVVVRGAVASGFCDNGRMHLVNVRGPGRFCAVGPVIEDQPASADYAVCENAVLLAIPQDEFAEVFRGVDRMAHSLVTAVAQHEALMVSRATNHLKRLVGLSRLYRQLNREPA